MQGFQGLALFGSCVAGTVLACKRNRGYLRSQDRSEYGTLVLDIDWGDGAEWRRYVSSGKGQNQPCELFVVNEYGESLLMFWVNEHGDISPSNYRLINGGSIKDSSVSNSHLEFTAPFHSFVLLRQAACSYPTHIKDVRVEELICCYRPETRGNRHILNVKSRSLGRAATISVQLSPLPDKGEAIDSTGKVYETMKLSGFTVHYEPGVFEEVVGIKDELQKGFNQLTRMIPEISCECLQSTTAVWLNRSLTYGNTVKPIVGRGCCYHPKDGQEWLRRNGCTTAKAGSIEIYSASDYLKDKDLWGCGGILMHEFSHAFHDKFCKDGYKNSDVDLAFKIAMKNKLYDSVTVHGPQGRDGPVKAYACANPMEFWAELSVAYMCTDDDCEYNKWFPFNQTQLICHDMDTFSVLDKLWREPYMENMP